MSQPNALEPWTRLQLAQYDDGFVNVVEWMSQEEQEYEAYYINEGGEWPHLVEIVDVEELEIGWGAFSHIIRVRGYYVYSDESDRLDDCTTYLATHEL